MTVTAAKTKAALQEDGIEGLRAGISMGRSQCTQAMSCTIWIALTLAVGLNLLFQTSIDGSKDLHPGR